MADVEVYQGALFPRLRLKKRKLLLLSRQLMAFLNLGRVSARKIDLDMMPDHVKRDIGLVDGRGPRYEDDR
jgi:hypothetical protein